MLADFEVGSGGWPPPPPELCTAPFQNCWDTRCCAQPSQRCFTHRADKRYALCRCSELVSLARVTHAFRRLSAIANCEVCQSRFACGSARGRGGRHSTRALAPSQRIFVVPIEKRPRQPPDAHMPSGRQPKVAFSVHGVAEN